MRSTKWYWATAAAAMSVFAGVTLPAEAITDGEPDNGRHPYVGLMVADDATGAPQWRCTGTLVSPRIFLTAGHCTFGAARATIWFEEDIQSQQAALGYPFGGRTSVDGTAYTHPLYDDNAFYLHDLGLVVLDKPVKMKRYGQLPALDSLDALKPSADTVFTSVGYGLQAVFPDPASWKDSAVKVRLVAHPHLVQINVPGYTGDGSMLLSNNASTGGTCFGDSGGPNFLGDSRVVAAVTSFGNSTCAGTGGVYRVDRADDLTWLATFGL